MTSKLKVEEITNLLPILASLLFGLFCAFLIAPQEVSEITPFPESNLDEGIISGRAFGSFGNALYFVILLAFGASLLLILFRRRKFMVIRGITILTSTMAVFVLSAIYLFAGLSRFNLFNFDSIILVVILASIITIVADFIIFKTEGKMYTLVVLLLGGALGTFLGSSIPTISAVLILIFLSIYDIFAVYHGPIGKLAENGLEKFRGMSISFGEIQIGLGDLTFYCMLSGFMLLRFGYLSNIASIFGMLLGSALSFKILQSKGIFPGLPLPVFIGLSVGFLASLI